MKGNSVIILSLALVTGSACCSLARTPLTADSELQLQGEPRPSAENHFIRSVLPIPSVMADGRQEVLQGYDADMSGITQQFSATVATITGTVENGRLSCEGGEAIAGEQYQMARMQFEKLNAWRDISSSDLARTEASQTSSKQSQNSGIVLVALPFSSLELDPALAEYLGLSSGQIRAIQDLMWRERRNLEPLMNQLRLGRVKLVAATDQLVAATDRGRASEQQLQILARAQAEMLSKLIVENARLQARIYKLLTADQRRKVDYLKRSSDR